MTLNTQDSLISQPQPQAPSQGKAPMSMTDGKRRREKKRREKRREKR
jgi:hypothetical protein